MSGSPHYVSDAHPVAVPTHVAFERDDLFVAEGDHRQPVDVRSVLDRVERQKAAVLEEMRRRRFERMRQYVDELINFQLQTGDPVHACKSLCDLAMKAKGMGLPSIQLEMTWRAVEVKNDDGWSWAQHGDALFQNDQLGKALAAYDRALLYTSDPQVQIGRAEVLKAQGRVEEALEAYGGVTTDFPWEGETAGPVSWWNDVPKRKLSGEEARKIGNAGVALGASGRGGRT